MCSWVPSSQQPRWKACLFRRRAVRSPRRDLLTHPCSLAGVRGNVAPSLLSGDVPKDAVPSRQGMWLLPSSSPAAACAAFRPQSWLWARLPGRWAAGGLCCVPGLHPPSPGTPAAPRPSWQPRRVSSECTGGPPGAAGVCWPLPCLAAHGVRRSGVHDPHCGPRASRDGLTTIDPALAARTVLLASLGLGAHGLCHPRGLLCRTPQVWEGRAGPGSTLGLPNTDRPAPPHPLLPGAERPAQEPARLSLRHGSRPPVTSGA